MGEEVNNATRWLTIPVINQSFQTSDLAKLAIIGYVARMLSHKKEELHSFKGAFVPIMLPVAMICTLILPSDLSTAAVVFISSVMLMFMAGLNWKYLFSLIPAGILAFGIIFMIAKVKPEIFPRAETWISRVESFFDKERNADRDYQPEMAKIAIATGEIIGKGPGNSSQRAFLPQSSSDFIYAIVIEEYGLIGGFVILILYLILLYRSIKIVQKCERSFGAFLVLGLSFSLVFQALINMSVAVNLLPVTGQPLPLVSLGGTSVWFTCISLGVILSVSRSIEKEAIAEEKRRGGNHVIA
jgi:cell division protein FtsW